MRIFWGFGLIAEAGIACFSFVELALKGAPIERWLLAVGIFGAFLILTGVGYYRLGPPPVEVTVDSRSLRFVQANGKIFTKGWDDSTFKLILREWNDYLIAGVTYPYRQDVSPLLAPNIPLSSEAFQAILKGARDHGISVDVEDIPGWWGTAHKEYHLRRK